MPIWDLGGIGSHTGAMCPDPAKIPAGNAVVRLLTSSPTLLEKRWAAGQQTNDAKIVRDLCGIWTHRSSMTADTTKIPDGHALVAPWRAGSLSPALRPPWPSEDSPGPEEETSKRKF